MFTRKSVGSAYCKPTQVKMDLMTLTLVEGHPHWYTLVDYNCDSGLENATNSVCQDFFSTIVTLNLDKGHLHCCALKVLTKECYIAHFDDCIDHSVRENASDTVFPRFSLSPCDLG